MEPDRRLKVCHVITRMIIGGAQENTLFTVEGLAQKGSYDVTLVTGPQTGPEGDLKYKISDEAPFHLRVERFLRRNINPVYDLLSFLRLYFFFRKGHFDIVHTHSSKVGILGRFAARAARVPIIVHTIHGLPFHPYQPRWVNRLYRWLEKIAARYCDRIVTVAEAMTKQAVQAHVADYQKFITIRSGMDLDTFIMSARNRDDVRKSLGLNSHDLVIGKIARLFHLKGHEYLIQAASEVVKEFPETKFLLVGDGILKDVLKERIRDLGLKRNFIFGGLVTPDDVPRMISVMDIVVHVSLREGLAKVIPQALASGKPVISFDLDGAREVIHDGDNGYLVSPCDTAALSRAILKLVRDRDLRKIMGEKGIRYVDPFYRKEYMVNKIDQLYHLLLEQKRKKSGAVV